MFAIIRRYEAIDQARAGELVKKIDASLAPRLSKLPGFGLVEAGDGVVSSIGFFDTSAQADESTKIASTWVRDEKLEKALPKAPRVSSGEIVAQQMRELVQA